MSGKYRILLPVSKSAATVPVLEIASSLLGAHGGEVLALGFVEVPQGRPMSYGTLNAYRQRRLIKRLIEADEARDMSVRSVVRVGRSAVPEIVRTAEEQDCDLVVLGWDILQGKQLLSGKLHDLVGKAERDIALVKPGRVRKNHNVLVAMRAGVHSTLALSIAGAICGHFDAKMSVLHINVEKSGTAFAGVSRVDEQAGDAGEHITVGPGEIAGAIIERAEDFDFIIMGASMSGFDQSDIGDVPKQVAREAKSTVIIVRSHRPDPVPVLEPYHRVETIADAEQESERLSEFVDKWFAENTFESREFERVDQLVELKRKQNLTISLGLPTLNEEETIGEIITMMKSELMEAVPLLDEIVLIDSGSTDRTLEIAAAAGIPVYQHPEILSEHGSYRGKGEALWKSLYILRGDIIAWIDTDIKNIHPQFVYGVLGPILRHPQLQYVKGFYHRPLRVDGGDMIQTGGGRVTELTARPLINQFFPALSGLVQPLSGEYAGRRSLLEQLSFYSGYGVEIGLLIDILDKFGLPVIGQVDLKKRIHRNQSLEALSKMSFAIIHAVMESLQDRHQVSFLHKINRRMSLIKRDDESFHLEPQEIFDYPRPPMITISEYRSRFTSLGVAPPESDARR